jgi:pseudouridine synthase
MRLNRFLARSGLASRRKAEEIILAGKVRLNGKPVDTLSTEVNPDKDTVEVGGEIVELPKFKYYALNKPAGYTCTRADVHAEHTVFELLPDDKSLFTVGRLDRETTGLLLITNDGNFAQNIIHPTNKIAKQYFIKLRKPHDKQQLENLMNGIALDDGGAKAKRVEAVSKTEIQMTIEMGRKRIVRRMVKAVGNEVDALERRSIGNIALDLKPGQYRDLTPNEVEPYV